MNERMKSLYRSLEPEGEGSHNSKLQAYLGTDKAVGNFSVPVLRKKISAWVKAHKDISREEWKLLLDILMKKGDYTGIFYSAMLLDYSAACRAALSTDDIYLYTAKLRGWGEVDAFSYGHYTAAEILKDKNNWENLLERLIKSEEPNRQRSAIVFLCKPLSHSPDPWFADQAVRAVSALKKSKDKLLSKAISWLLRSMGKHHKGLVREILEKESGSLPAFLIREVKNKLQYGTKSGK